MSNDTVMISGGFDPIHVGHIRLIREAARYGNVIVAMNSDEWIFRQKGFNSIGFNERKEFLMAIKGVVEVVSQSRSGCLILYKQCFLECCFRFYFHHLQSKLAYAQ